MGGGVVSAEPHVHPIAPAPLECPECEETRRLLMEERIRRNDLERDLASLRRRRTMLENELAEKRQRDPLAETAQTIWEYWRMKCKPRALKMSDRQLKALLKVLKEKDPAGEPVYPPRYVCEAIVGCAREHYVDGRGKHHVGLELICAQVEEMHDRWERANASATNGR
jgi:hypothetical protein